MTNKKVALVLEGGGVKCAYQVGSIMALEELGYSFNAISGASFGALNGALYIEGGVKKLFDFYSSLEAKDIFIDDKLAEFVNNYSDDKESFTQTFLAYVKDNYPDALERRDEVSNHYHTFVSSKINEKAVNDSPIDFMFSVLEVNNSPLIIPLIIGAYFSRNLAPLQLMISSGSIKPKIIDKVDCSKGSLPLYVAASANYPFFNPMLVEDAYYLDGGITNNVPYQALLDSGYEEMIIIRTKSDELQGKIPQNEHILQIIPSENLGSSLQFTHDNIMELLKLGYQDTMTKFKSNN